MKYRARVAGFIGRRVKAGEVFDFDGDIPWADVVEPEPKPDPEAASPAPKVVKQRRGEKVVDEAEEDAI